MVNIDNLYRYSEPVAHIYRSLETELLRMISKRLSQGKPPGDDVDYVLQWQARKMQELGILNQDVLKMLSVTTGVAEEEIRKAIEDVGFKTVQSVDEELKYVFEPLPYPNDLQQVIDGYISQTFRELNNYVNQTLITTHFGEGTVSKAYRRIVEETTGKAISGVTTFREALEETVVRWSKRGIETGFKDRRGRIWTLEHYADTVLRSTINRTYNELRTARMEDYGVDLVVVTSLPDPRDICSKIQGKIASIKRPQENDTKYPSIYEYGYGTPGGLRGVNCRHMFYPFVEGLSVNNQPQYTEKQMKQGRENSQRQRLLERRIREAKRELMVLEELKASPEKIEAAKRKVRVRQAHLREFIADTGSVRLRHREQVYHSGRVKKA